MARSTEPARSPSPGGASGTLLSAADVARVVDRMAHQLIERAASARPEDGGDRGDGGLADLVLVGIPTRGVPLARRLAARIEAFTGTGIDVGTADITLYRDDLRLRGVRALEPTVLPDAGIDDRLGRLRGGGRCSGRAAPAPTPCAPDGRGGRRRPRSVTLAARAGCRWPCSSTGATGSCRSGR